LGINGGFNGVLMGNLMRISRDLIGDFQWGYHVGILYGVFVSEFLDWGLNVGILYWGF